MIQFVLDDRGRVTSQQRRSGDAFPSNHLGWVTFERRTDASTQNRRQTITARTSAGKLRWRWDVAAMTPGWQDVEVMSLHGNRDGTSYAAARCSGPDPKTPGAMRAGMCALRVTAAGKVDWIVRLELLSPAAHAEIVERLFGGVVNTNTAFQWWASGVREALGPGSAVGVSTSPRR